MLKKFLLLSVSLLFFQSAFSQSDLVVTELKVPGSVSDYAVADLNRDGLQDFVVSFVSTAGPKAGNRFIGTFLQTPDGFYQDANQTLQLDLSVMAFEIADMTGDGAPELILFQPAGVGMMPFVNGNFRKDLLKSISDLPVNIPGPDKNYFPRLASCVGSNENSFDQLVYPSGNFIVVISGGKQKPASPQKLSWPQDVSLNSSSAEGINLQVELPKPVAMPYSSGSSTDLILISEKKLVLFPGDQTGFSTQGEVAFQFSASPDETGRILKAGDFNGDSVPDVFAERRKQTDVTEKEATYEFYWGYRDSKGKTHIKLKPDQVISGAGLLIQGSFNDLNRDGRSDFVLMEAKVNVTSFLTSFVTRETKVGYKFFLQKNQRYTASPTLERDIPQSFNLRKEFNRTFLMSVDADIDGDGFHDLITFKDQKTVMVFAGIQSNIISAQPAYEVSVALPQEADNIRALSVFEPKRHDLVIRYSQKDPANLRSQIKIISR